MAGRPSKLTEEAMNEICLRVADGETVRQIGASEHLPAAQNIYLALAADEAFRDQYARAREAQLERWEDEIVEIADNGTNDWMLRNHGDDDEGYRVNGEHIQRSRVRIDTRKWLMAKRMPKKYGERIDHDVRTGPLDGMTEEQLRAQILQDAKTLGLVTGE